MTIIEQILHQPPCRPHPAKVFLSACPDSQTLSLECACCGDTWVVPTDYRGEPWLDLGLNRMDIISCPACGTITLQIPQEQAAE